MLKHIESTKGPDHIDCINHLIHIGDILRDQGEVEEALKYYRRFVTITETAWGPQDPRFARGLSRFGKALLWLNRLDEALAVYQRSLAVRESTLGPTHVEIADSLSGLAEVSMEQRKFEEASALARRAIAILEANTHRPLDLAKARFTLAQSLWSSNGRRAEAVDQARQARHLLRGMSDEQFYRDQLDEIETWLASVGTPPVAN